MENLTRIVATQHSAPITATDSIIIIGAGPVGIRAAQLLLEQNITTPIIIYGDEPWKPYNRAQLSAYLHGQVNFESIFNAFQLTNKPNLIQKYNCRVVSIHPEQSSIIDEHGTQVSYSKLIIATGSRPIVPRITGICLQGVHHFRDLSDIQQLRVSRHVSRNIVILGGGILGIEAAYAMSTADNQVTIIDRAEILMYRNLDTDASNILQKHMQNAGIKCLLAVEITSINGDRRVSSVTLNNSTDVSCDALILAIGIHANTELAKQAGVVIGKGIKVNDNMQTSFSTIYAIGECAEHNGKIHGLLTPGYEQASVAINHIVGKEAKYHSFAPITKIKITEQQVFSAGKIAQEEITKNTKIITHRSQNDIYRKLYIEQGRLIGVIATGKWSQAQQAYEAVQKQARIRAWDQWKFKHYGEIPAEQNRIPVHQWHPNTLICHCMGITRGACSKAIESGCDELTLLVEKTTAGTVCGNCIIRLQEILGGIVKPVKEKNATLIGMLGIIILLYLTALLWFGPIQHHFTTITNSVVEKLWRSVTLRQVTGYSTLTVSLLLLLLSLRRRLKQFTWKSFSEWRVFHVVAGVVAVILTLAHTGGRIGFGINSALMILFYGAVLSGSILSILISMQHKIHAGYFTTLRKNISNLHTMLLIIAPVIVLLHIANSYIY